VKIAADLNTAVLAAYRAARTLLANGYWLTASIIFSPGAASFDMFKNYADRGKKFKAIIRSLTL